MKRITGLIVLLMSLAATPAAIADPGDGGCLGSCFNEYQWCKQACLHEYKDDAFGDCVYQCGLAYDSCCAPAAAAGPVIAKDSPEPSGGVGVALASIEPSRCELGCRMEFQSCMYNTCKHFGNGDCAECEWAYNSCLSGCAP
jgi:hypothetical protein